jgi:hypothetical protein
MKVAKRRSSRRPALDLRAQSFSLSRAKTYLGRLVKKALNGEPVYIVRGQQRFLLQHVPEIDPIPIRPPGYFAHCDTREEIESDNVLSKASVVRPPQDLE